MKNVYVIQSYDKYGIGILIDLGCFKSKKQAQQVCDKLVCDEKEIEKSNTNPMLYEVIELEVH